MIGFVEKIIDETTVLIKGLDQDKTIEVKVDKFTIAEYKELIHGEELIIVVVNEDTNTIDSVAEI